MEEISVNISLDSHPKRAARKKKASTKPGKPPAKRPKKAKSARDARHLARMKRKAEAEIALKKKLVPAGRKSKALSAPTRKNPPRSSKSSNRTGASANSSLPQVVQEPAKAKSETNKTPSACLLQNAAVTKSKENCEVKMTEENTFDRDEEECTLPVSPRLPDATKGDQVVQVETLKAKVLLKSSDLSKQTCTGHTTALSQAKSRKDDQQESKENVHQDSVSRRRSSRRRNPTMLYRPEDGGFIACRPLQAMLSDSRKSEAEAGSRKDPIDLSKDEACKTGTKTISATKLKKSYATSPNEPFDGVVEVNRSTGLVRSDAVELRNYGRPDSGVTNFAQLKNHYFPVFYEILLRRLDYATCDNPILILSLKWRLKPTCRKRWVALIDAGGPQPGPELEALITETLTG